MADQGTLATLAHHLIRALDPLRKAVESPEQFKIFIYRLGWSAGSLPPEYLALGGKVADAVGALEALVSDPEFGEVIELFNKIKAVFEAIENLSEAPAGIDAGQFIPDITARLFETLLVDYLAAEAAVGYNFFQMTGVIKEEQVFSSAERPSFITTRVLWEEIPKIISQPDTLPERIFGWGTPEFKSERFFNLFSELLYVTGLMASIAKVDDELAKKYQDNPAAPIRYKLKVPFYYINIGGSTRELSIDILELPAHGGKLPGLIIQPNLPSEIGETLRLSDSIDLTIRANSNINSLFGLVIRPGEFTVIYPNAGAPLPEGGFGMGFVFNPAEPLILVGNPNDTRLELKKVSIDFGLNLSATEQEVLLRAGFEDLAFVISTGESDGFVKTLLGDGEKRIALSLGMQWSSKHGLHIEGGGGFEIASHPHLSLGPITIDEFLLRLFVPQEPKPKINLELGISAAANLGPLHVVVANMGLGLYTTFEKGNAGPFNIDLGFKPPNGVGISVNAEVVTGGGFLYFDSAKGEYFGSMELSFKGLFDLKAIGIINTKMPDGSDGFSLLILITAEFSPVQLGFGFTLIGVGGLLGLNRTMDVEALRIGLRTGAIKSVLFPEDVVGNINQIISDIRQIFPIKEGSFVIGLMGKIGWGTPTLITIELGFLIELPDPRIVILGVIKTVLPNENAELLKIQVNFLGVIDFQNEFIYFEARLFESHLVGFPLTGSLAFVVAWGRQATFGISIGGFHPDFRDYPTVPTLPGAFRDMDRVGLQLLSGDNPRLGVECYFAVTSNSVQFGAKAELYAGGPMGFNLYGMLAFDALFIFNPFHFIISLEATLAIRHDESILFGIHFKGSLSGPTPWHVEGEVSFSICWFITITIGFSATWGDPPPLADTATENLLEKLQEELANNSNWRIVVPDYHNLHVSLREMTEEEKTRLIIHPFGQLIFSQRTLPLNYTIQKFGNRKPEGVNFFKITGVKLGESDAGSLLTEREMFAPGHFTELSESEKLSRKSFELMDSGVQLADAGQISAPKTKLGPVELNYELDYTGDDKQLEKSDNKLDFSTFNHLSRNGAASKSAVSWVKTNVSPLNGPEKVAVQEGGYVVAWTKDMKAVSPDLTSDTLAGANQLMGQWLTANPDKAGQVQVLEEYEAN